MKKLLLTLLLLSSVCVYAQTINGTVVDKSNQPILGANIFLENTYLGGMTDIHGEFSFNVNVEGKQTLIISFLGYKERKITCLISEMQNLRIVLKKKINSLDAVTITAGSFSAGGNSKIAALNSLDVVTTAGSAGNLVAAFQKLPGSTINGESSKLFIRGGDSQETQTFIDGMRVFKPYSSSPNNIPSRSRFSPMLFKGMNLNTGGYSAEFGQALSGILLLNTKDIPFEETTDISIMSVGLGLGKTIKGKNNSLTFNSSYTNLKPYLKLFPSRYKWIKPFESYGGEAIYRHQLGRGLFKVYTGLSTNNFHLLQDNINYNKPVEYETRDNDLYLNSNYKGEVMDNLLLYAGLGYSYSNKNDIAISSITNKREHKNHNMHMKLSLKKIFNESFKLNMGIEHFIKNINQDLYSSEYDAWLKQDLNTNLSAAFTEADLTISHVFAIRFGIRGEYSDYTKDYKIAPRLSIAQKISEHNQISIAYGKFYQSAQDRYRITTQDLISENSEQFIFNFQHNSTGRMLRTEIYYKKYNNLIKYGDDNNNYNNDGRGYAKGLDVLWKDTKSIRFMDYMISYSYMDSERDYLYYPVEAPTRFTAKHNLSVTCKYWIDRLHSLVGMSYSFNSGRPYNNPNKDSFMSETTKAYNDISLNWSYLINQQTILFFSVSNILGFNNIYSYDYATARNNLGTYDRAPVIPSSKRFFMAGLFITISNNKKLNQLDKL